MACILASHNNIYACQQLIFGFGITVGVWYRKIVGSRVVIDASRGSRVVIDASRVINQY